MDAERTVRTGLREQKKARHRGKAKIKNHNKVMEKKFIKESDLGEILEYLAEKALKNVEKVELEITFGDFLNELTMNVRLREKQTRETLVRQSYTIIKNVQDEYGISEDIFDKGFKEMERKAAQKKAEEEERKAAEAAESVTDNGEDND